MKPSVNPAYVTCPYGSTPPSSRWSEAVSGVELGQLNPHASTSTLRLRPDTRIGTAGSCFAQNIARNLRSRGFTFYVTEPAPPWLGPEDRAAYNYEVFSARYGNVYTALQLLQLFERAFSDSRYEHHVWQSESGRFFDVLRPRIQPHGFGSMDELLLDRSQHLRAVRHFLETVEVFVFTLGLTEAWISTIDGTVFPICPGCGFGTFDSAQYEFRNFTTVEVVEHLDQFVMALRRVNPNCQIILTVSPVPLAATMEPRHVLQSTVLSKSILRVAADEIERRYSHVHYFAAYEIITATLRSHLYYSADRRNVTPEGVSHVMKMFFQHFTDVPQAATDANADATGGAFLTVGTETETRCVDAVPTAPPELDVCDEYEIYRAFASRRDEK